MPVSDLLSRIQSDDLILIIGILAVCITAVAIVVAGVWWGIRARHIAAALKQDMLDRGMSAEEIRVVLEAGSNNLRN